MVRAANSNILVLRGPYTSVAVRTLGWEATDTADKVIIKQVKATSTHVLKTSIVQHCSARLRLKVNSTLDVVVRVIRQVSQLAHGTPIRCGELLRVGSKSDTI
jgi:hypothetical protein